MRDRRDLSLTLRPTISTGPAGRPRAGLSADAADAARFAEPRAIGRRLYYLQSATAADPGNVQANWYGHRGVPPQPPGQVRQPHEAVRGPGGHRPRPLCDLRSHRPQLRPAVRTDTRLQMEMVQPGLQRPAGQ